MKIREVIIILIAIIAVSSAIFSWFKPAKEIVGPTVWRDVTKEVIITKKVPVKVNNCQIMSIPSQNAVNADSVTIAEGTVPASKGGFELKTDLSPSTGEARIYAIPKKLSFMGFEDEKHVKILTDGNGGFINAGWTFARVGVFHLSIEGLIWNIPLKGSGVYGGLGISAVF